MTENTNNKQKTNTTGSNLLMLTTSIMCAIILVVCFIAFRTIENTAQAVTVLLSGIVLDIIIFVNGTSKR